MGWSYSDGRWQGAEHCKWTEYWSWGANTVGVWMPFVWIMSCDSTLPQLSYFPHCITNIASYIMYNCDRWLHLMLYLTSEKYNQELVRVNMSFFFLNCSDYLRCHCKPTIFLMFSHNFSHVCINPQFFSCSPSWISSQKHFSGNTIRV